jgi:hypothetical protein
MQLPPHSVRGSLMLGNLVPDHLDLPAPLFFCLFLQTVSLARPSHFPLPLIIRSFDCFAFGNGDLHRMMFQDVHTKAEKLEHSIFLSTELTH